MHDGRKTVSNKNGKMFFMFGKCAYGFSDFFFSKRVERRCRFIKNNNTRLAKQCARDGQTLLFSSRYFYSAFTDNCVKSFVCPGKQRLTGSLLQHFQTFIIRCFWIDE